MLKADTQSTNATWVGFVISNLSNHEIWTYYPFTIEKRNEKREKSRAYIFKRVLYYN